MSSPILLTKLNAPQLRSQLVPRPKLVQKMNDGLSGKLTLVSAPAGYGKTTLVAEWLSQQSEHYKSSWISLDENDNDPVRFLAYIIAAIQKIRPNFGESTNPLLKSPQPPPGEVILTSVLNEVAGIPAPIILILDDYHAIHTPTIHKNLATWLEHQPASIHLVIISREDPLLPIARLRADGHLSEIRQGDLRFSYQECANLLQDVMGMSISSDDVAALERRTEGWIAGLQLAAVSIQQQDDPNSFIKAFTGSSRFILDYLIDEVFSRQSVNMQQFLMKTSILERLSGALCQAITDQEDSQERLEALEQTNLFIFPLDQSRTWYRYHRLFSELLRHRLRRTAGKTIPDLHNRASLWFEQHNFTSEAIQHAIAAENWDQVVRILKKVSDGILKQGGITTLVRWYSTLPRNVLLQDPHVCLDYAWSLLLTGQFVEAGEILDHIEIIAQEIPPFLGEIMTAQAYQARATGQHARMVERSEQARALLPPESVESRCMVAINLSLAYWHLGQMQATEAVLKEAIQTSRVSDNTYALTTAIILQARVLAVRGQLTAAEPIWRQAVDDGGEIPINALAHLDLSALHYEWNQLDKAEIHLQNAFELSRRGHNAEFEVACWMMQSTLEKSRGNLSKAEAALASAQRLIEKVDIPTPTVTRFEVARLRLALFQDDLETAEQFIGSVADDIDSLNFCRYTNLAKASYLLAQNKREQAEKYLAGLVKKAEQHDWGYTLIMIRAYQALATRSHENAIAYLNAALKTAKPEGFLRTFVDIGHELVPLLQESARMGVEPVYIGRILAAIHDGTTTPTLTSDLAEPLSEREMQVLRLLVAGLSNREIANDLVISLGTAKTHIHNIYGKLDVSNRAQAIARAREIELV